MVQPTILGKENIRHIVKDKNKCFCGYVYNSFPTIIKKDLKRIYFYPYEKIDCPVCKNVLIKQMHFISLPAESSPKQFSSLS